MAKTLDKSTLIALLERWSAWSSDPVRHLTDQVAQRVSVDCPVVTTDDPAVRDLRHIVGQFAFMISPDQLGQLEKTNIFVVPEPVCNALADPVGRTIVICTGLLEAISFRLVLSLLISAVRKRLVGPAPKSRMTEHDFKDLAVKAAVLPIHFMRTGNTLPPILDKLDDQLRQDAFVGYAGMLLFILFHELGHVVLNHGTTIGGSTPELVPALACGELLSGAKLNEFEADRYAYEAMVPQARPAFIVNAWFTLKVFTEFEYMSGAALAMHPFTINRINHLNGLPGVMDDPTVRQNAQNIFDADFRLMQSRIAQRHPAEAAIPPDRIRTMNKEALYRVLAPEAECQDAVSRLLQVYLEAD